MIASRGRATAQKLTQLDNRFDLEWIVPLEPRRELRPHYQATVPVGQAIPMVTVQGVILSP